MCRPFPDTGWKVQMFKMQVSGHACLCFPNSMAGSVKENRADLVKYVTF